MGSIAPRVLRPGSGVELMRDKETKRMSAKLGIAVFTVTLALAVGISAAPAFAIEQMKIDSFTTTTSSTQAGGHPDFGTSFTLDESGVTQAPRNISFDAPEGLFGNPNALVQCTSTDFALQECPSATQAGLITIRANYNGNPDSLLGTAPIFDLDPGDNTALFAFIVPKLDIPIQIPVAVRTGTDFGLRFTVSEITQLAPLVGANLTFWGFPADDSHDSERFTKGSYGKPAGCVDIETAACISAPIHASNAPKPLSSNPTICSGQPLVTSLTVDTYQNPNSPSVAQSSYPPITGCEHEVFRPVLYVNPTTPETDAPSGLNIDLVSPQFLTRADAPSQIRSAIVTLPPELTVNPDAADGQRSCSDAEVNFGSEGPANCPDNAKIGTFALHTLALDGALEGAIYIGVPKPGNQYRLFLIADGFGIHAKLEAEVRPDPATGQITVHLVDLPQVPFDSIQMHLFASDRGLMATPTHCGLYPVSAQFFPWNQTLADQTSVQAFSLDSGPNNSSCPGEKRPFNPRLVAGTSVPTAGAFSDFHLKLDRDDGDQFLRDVNFTMPPGFTGDLSGISYCPEASIAAAAKNPGLTEQASPSCPASSQIGTSNVAAGPGTHPFHAVGKMYLAGPLNGAPLSLAVITPALAGPYDYGTIVVRVALHVDPLTAQVRALSDSVPLIVGGIPIRMRSIQVNIDRPNFTINPTNCSAMSVDSQGIGDQGTVTDFSSYFQAVNCVTLPFKPKMTISQLGGKKATHRAVNPGLQIDLRTRSGDANIKSISVTLSSAFEIDQRHLGNLCSEKELTEKQCAGRTAIGKATTTTPLLDQPLTGPVYAVSGSGGLPRLAFILDGQVKLVPRADTKTTGDGRLRTTVPVVPDASIGHFALTVFGGKTGYLINTRDICVHTPVISVAYGGQNGKSSSQQIKVKTKCGKKQGRTKRHSR
jgi:hypothetical protein